MNKLYIYIYIYIYVCVCECVCVCVRCVQKVEGSYDKFPDFFRMSIKNCRRLLKIHYVIAIHLMR